MKITEMESGKAGGPQQDPASSILPEEFRANLHQPKARRAKTSREEAIEVAMKAMEEVPDVREDVVADLKARIESGQYKVAGEDVADMMIRRMKADRIR
ncbi:MAG: flagellar biosynthesis anti-sigma factor FlgM [Armatimonadetes bacterium]|nr:flagellar biosynthesis anti-sigma factor FlgM [Armatimonadota bacterium]